MNINNQLPMSNLAIPKGSLVLVTGANGFISSHIVDQILKAGYKVRGTSRDSTKAAWISEYFNKKYGSKTFEGVVVEDMAKAGAFNNAVKGCAGVVHVASDMTFRPNPEEVIPPVVAGVKNALEAAAAESSVKRFVLTSSSTAATLPKPNKKFHVDASTWNDEAVEIAQKPPPYENDRAYAVYAASKTLGEREAWKFVKTNKPNFVFNAVLPNFNVGHILVPEKQTGSSAGMIKGFYNGVQEKVDTLRNFIPQYFVDVQDVALLHLAGLMYEDIQAERLLAFTSPFNFNTWVDVMKKISPEKSFPEKLANPDQDLSTVDMKRPIEILERMGRPGLTSIEDSARSCVQS